MKQQSICQCVIASMLAVTATAWAQAPVDISISGSADRVARGSNHPPIQLSSSVFEIRARSLHAGCHALQGPRCNTRVGKSPSQ